MTPLLVWFERDFGIFEATYESCEFRIHEGSVTELRIIRRENVGGVIAPMGDYSIYAANVREAKSIAKMFAKEIRKVRKYNKLEPLF